MPLVTIACLYGCQGYGLCRSYGQLKCLDFNYATSCIGNLHWVATSLRQLLSIPFIGLTLADSSGLSCLNNIYWSNVKCQFYSPFELTTRSNGEQHCVRLSLACQCSISTSCPNYSFNISNCLCILRIIVVLDSLYSTCYIYFLTCYQYRHCTWDSSQQLCCHFSRSNDWSNYIVVNCICSFSCPCQESRIQQ